MAVQKAGGVPKLYRKLRIVEKWPVSALPKSRFRASERAAGILPTVLFCIFLVRICKFLIINYLHSEFQAENQSPPAHENAPRLRRHPRGALPVRFRQPPDFRGQ